jgi:hypothetical protein
MSVLINRSIASSSVLVERWATTIAAIAGGAPEQRSTVPYRSRYWPPEHAGKCSVNKGRLRHGPVLTGVPILTPHRGSIKPTTMLLPVAIHFPTEFSESRLFSAQTYSSTSRFGCSSNNVFLVHGRK